MMNPTRWIIPLALLGLCTDARADDEKVEIKDLPKAVARSARKAYPEAKMVGASKEKDDEGKTVFEVEMTLGGKTLDLILDEEGEIEAVEKEIEVEDLPRAVLKVARAKFPNAKIVKVEEITEEDDKVVYELAIQAEGDDTSEIVMAPNGKILEVEDDEPETEEAREKPKD